VSCVDATPDIPLFISGGYYNVTGAENVRLTDYEHAHDEEKPELTSELTGLYSSITGGAFDFALGTASSTHSSRIARRSRSSSRARSANGHTGGYPGRMRSDLPALARDIGVPERTLRRAVQRGTVRCHRPGVRQVELASDERAYLRDNWQTISTLTEALRTERNVRLAVLFGSMARGHAGPDSDIDVLVSLAEDRPDAAVKLAVRLERTLGRSVDIARLERVDAQAPLLLDRVLDEGRVLVDRDGQWRLLSERHGVIRARARRDHRRQMAGAARAIEELTR